MKGFGKGWHVPTYYLTHLRDINIVSIWAQPILFP
jgi:hypothetical protein